MTKLVLRGFLQRKLRVLLTGIAIALGVALMAGTYILTDTINHSFAGIFQTANQRQRRRRQPDRSARQRNHLRSLADHRTDARAGARHAGRRRRRPARSSPRRRSSTATAND